MTPIDILMSSDVLKINQSISLQVTWEKYLRHHRAPPCPVYAAVYDEKTKGIKLVFWKQYVEEYLPKDLEVRDQSESSIW